MFFLNVMGSGVSLEPGEARSTAQKLFRRALSRGRLRRLFNRLRRGEDSLRRFASGISSSYSQRQAGRARPISIEKIVGSEDKGAGSFDKNFLPKDERSRQRWEGVAAAVLRGEDLPAVVLLEGPDGFYVRDGHHRISVSKALGQVAVDARIVVG